MGEVYRARDPRLGRDVAIEVLPEELARDAERLDGADRECEIYRADHPLATTGVTADGRAVLFSDHGLRAGRIHRAAMDASGGAARELPAEGEGYEQAGVVSPFGWRNKGDVSRSGPLGTATCTTSYTLHLMRHTHTGSYHPQSQDTDEAIDRYLFDRLRELPPWRKAEMLTACNRAAHGLAMAGLRQRYPRATAAELRRRYAALVLGRDASIALFGWDPEEEGW
jgi:hypothetical protein